MKRTAFTSDKRLCNGSLVEHAGEFYACEFERWAPCDTVFLVERADGLVDWQFPSFEYRGSKYIGR